MKTVKMVRQGLYQPEDLVEGLKNAAYWRRVPFNAICQEALRRELARLELEHGGVYRPRPTAVKALKNR